MNERVRSVVFGLGVGIAPLLLLDLAGILQDAIANDPGSTSVWWPIACFFAAGVVAAVGVGSGRRDRLIPAVAGLAILLIALPTVPSDVPSWVPALPLVPSGGAAQAVVFALAGAYGYAAVRGGRA